MDTQTLTPNVWIEIARQVPAVLAFLFIVMVINRNYINQNSTIINSFLSHLQAQNEGEKAAMKEIAASLETMGTKIVDRLDQHDDAVETKVVQAIQRYNGIERRHAESEQAEKAKTTIKKRNSKRENTT